MAGRRQNVKSITPALIQHRTRPHFFEEQKLPVPPPTMRTTTGPLLLAAPFLAAALPADYGYGDYGYGGGGNEDFVGPWGDATYAGGQGFTVTADFPFTSYHEVKSTPEQVVNGTGAATGGLSGSYSTWRIALNGPQNVACWHIESYGFAGAYQSPAVTATHVHEGARGAAGPPRLAFPNPEEDADSNDGARISRGCFTGPFTTGVLVNGADAGAGFTVQRLEDNPSAFYVDIHSSLAVPGASRGQIE